MTDRVFDLNDATSLYLSYDIDEDIVYNFSLKIFRKILIHCFKMDVSDVFFQEGFPVMIKINGLIFPISKTKLQRNSMLNVTSFIHHAREGDDSVFTRVMLGNTSNTTYLFKLKNKDVITKIRYRCNVIKEGASSVTATLRLNNEDIKNLNDIGLNKDHPIFLNMFPQKGLVLVTGATDSGKTTLLYSCLKGFLLLDERNVSINTYESPIEGDLISVLKEFNITNKIVSQVEVPGGTPSFTSGIEESLRRNTDIILVGEVRTASEVSGVINGILSTGRLILGTMHTDNVSVTLNRMINVLNTTSGDELKSKVYDLLTSFHMIVSQKLLETVDKKRVAVHEWLIFTEDIKHRLLSLPINMISDEIKKIMKDNNATMVDKAKILYTDGVISKNIFERFKKSFSY